MSRRLKLCELLSIHPNAELHPPADRCIIVRTSAAPFTPALPSACWPAINPATSHPSHPRSQRLRTHIFSTRTLSVRYLRECIVCVYIGMIHARMGNAQPMGHPKYNLFKKYEKIDVEFRQTNGWTWIVHLNLLSGQLVNFLGGFL